MKEKNKKCKLSVKTGILNNNSSRKTAIILGIFALVIVTTSASFAFFTYSRTGTTTSTIISDDIEFSFIEGTSATLANAFPVADSVGAVDTTGEYSFEVKLKSSSNSNKMNYNVGLVDNNNQSDVNYFNNEQIKFSLVKNNIYVAGSSTTSGVKLSSVPGFEEGSSTGVGYVLENQEITAGTTDSYKLRIWISDDVDYSNTQNGQDNQESIGKYNSHTYSLKVKVTSGLATTISVDNLKTAGPIITAELSDPNGLAAYAITNSNTTPLDSEWIEITNDSAKSKTMRLASSLITRKTITHEVTTSGTYYLHIKNKKDEVITKEVKVNIQKYNISFDGNGGISTENSKEVTNELTYGVLPTATRTGYVFDGWYTSKTDGEKITKESIVNIKSEQILYARWISKTFASKENVLEEFTGTTAETIMCSETESGDFYNCDEKTLMQTASEDRDGRIFLLKDVNYDEQIIFSKNNKLVDLDGKNIDVNNGIYASNDINLTIKDLNGTSTIKSSSKHTFIITDTSNLTIENVNLTYTGSTDALVGFASKCTSCNVELKKIKGQSGNNGVSYNPSAINSTLSIVDSEILATKRVVNQNGTNNNTDISGGKYESTQEYAVFNAGGNIDINNAYIYSNISNSVVLNSGSNVTVTINGDYPTFDSLGNYVSGMYIDSNYDNGASIHVYGGTLKINGGYINHRAADNGTWRQHAIRMDGGVSNLNGGTLESKGMQQVNSNDGLIYLNGNSSIVKVNGAIIKGNIALNDNDETGNYSPSAYICKGSINELHGNRKSLAYIKSSGITWGTIPTFDQYIIQDDTITCE